MIPRLGDEELKDFRKDVIWNNATAIPLALDGGLR